MPDTIYSWGREKKVQRGPNDEVKVPTQMMITKHGLVPTDIPVYEPPPEGPRRTSKGVYDYDPLGGW